MRTLCSRIYPSQQWAAGNWVEKSTASPTSAAAPASLPKQHTRGLRCMQGGFEAWLRIAALLQLESHRLRFSWRTRFAEVFDLLVAAEIVWKGTAFLRVSLIAHTALLRV